MIVSGSVELENMVESTGNGKAIGQSVAELCSLTSSSTDRLTIAQLRCGFKYLKLSKSFCSTFTWDVASGHRPRIA